MGMGFKAKSKNSSNSCEGWGMGFLLVFFPEEPNRKPNNFNSIFSSAPSSLIKRSNSNHLFHKAQSTISICLLLLFTTLLLFTLSTLPSSSSSAASSVSAAARRVYSVPRRQLSPRVKEFSGSASNLSHALQGMGTLYRRGTRAMSDLIVAHAVESLTQHELKLFLRLLYRSSLTSRSDLLFIFPSKTAAFDDIILQENDSFLKLVTQYSGNPSNRTSAASFDVTQFVKMGKKEKESGDSIWGKRSRSNFTEDGGTESTRLSYGSVVGFDVEELDPENSLSGFLDHVPMSLRRWACYPMLLGRVRRNFKNMMLVDVKEMLLLGDPLGRFRSQSPESVLLRVAPQPTSSKHTKKNSDKTHSPRVHPGIIMGGSRGVRRLSNALLTDIVRATVQHKKKNPVTESGLLNQLVGNEFVLKNVNVIVSTESVPELSSLPGKSGSHLFPWNYTLIRRSNSNLDVNSVLMRHICALPIDFIIYGDC